MQEFRLDRTAFFAGTHEQVEERNRKYWQQSSYKELIEESEYLSSIAFKYDFNNMPTLDKQAFSMRKRNHDSNTEF